MNRAAVRVQPLQDCPKLQNCGTGEVSIAPVREAICAVVVTYHPDSNLLSRVERVVEQVAQVLIVDNGSSELCVGRIRELADKLNVHLILNKCNGGVAQALNEGARWADEQGYRWVLTLDQDTVVADDIVETLSAVYEEFADKERLALIGSNYRDPISGGLFLPLSCDDHCSWQEVKTAITSGSIISLSIYHAIGPFREEFFIDCVDCEYCLRARSLGFNVIMARKPLLQHTIGATTMHKLPWKMTGTTNHSPVRRYYMTRNQLVLAREYLRREPVWTLSTLYRHLKSTISMCLFEKDILRKLKYTAIGVLDGLFSNFSRNLG